MIPENVLLKNIHEIGEEEYRFAYFAMSENRRKKCDGYRFMNDKRLCIAADWLLRKGLREKYGFAEEPLISVSDSGKPFLMNFSVYFSISHSGDYAAVAFDTVPVGLDIEKIKPVNLSVIKKFCSEDEMFYIAGSERTGTTDSPEVVERFFRVWTFKEAYAKAKGTGLTDDIIRVSFFETDKTVFFFDGYAGTIVKTGIP